MKRIIGLTVAVFVMLFGASSAHAATPEDCAESDNVPPGIECPVDGNNYPIELPEGGSIPEPEPTTPPTTVATVLPATGSDGTSGILQIGALVLTGGLIIAAAARRRDTAPAT